MEDKLKKGGISQEEFDDLDKRWDFGDYKDKGYTTWSYFGTIQDKMGSNDYYHNPDLHGGYTDPVDILGHHNVLPSKEQEKWDKDNKKDVAEKLEMTMPTLNSSQSRCKIKSSYRCYNTHDWLWLL
mgnify:CR=1 FL=1